MAFLGLDFFGSGGAARMRLAAASKLMPFNLKSMAFDIFSLYLTALYHFAFRINSKKSNSLLEKKPSDAHPQNSTADNCPFNNQCQFEIGFSRRLIHWRKLAGKNVGRVFEN